MKKFKKALTWIGTLLLADIVVIILLSIWSIWTIMTLYPEVSVQKFWQFYQEWNLGLCIISVTAIDLFAVGRAIYLMIRKKKNSKKQGREKDLK